MRYVLILFFFSFCVVSASAQEKHFVFIQSENNQLFYASLNGKLYSSTDIGYLIIPKLANGNYDFSIGFAKNAFPEQAFHCVINDKDLGFSLKNYGEKGWGLFNLQSLAVSMGETSNADNISKALSEKETVKDDTDPVISFNRKKKEAKTKALAQQTVDSVGSEPVSKIENQSKDNPISGDTSTQSNQSENANAEGDVTKVSESKVEDGVHLSYVDGNNKRGGDTVNVIIPSEKSATNTVNSNTSGSGTTSDANASSSQPAATEVAASSSDSLKFLDINGDKSKKEELVNTSGSTTNASVPAITNSKCKDIANEDDYTKLRRKMAGETTDEKMIGVARKMYKNKCFTTSQIKRLSTLFLSDEGRYNFFNASYNSVSDVNEYSSLQTEFIDPAFAQRFKGILR